MHPEKSVRVSVSAVVMDYARAFSLIEVVVAVGMVSFTVLAIMGMLTTALGITQSAAAAQFEGVIAEQLRSEVQQLSPHVIQGLDGQTRYYSHEGREVALQQDAYYVLSLRVGNPVVAGTPPTGLEPWLKIVRATLEFPLGAPAANREKRVISLLAAAQGGV